MVKHIKYDNAYFSPVSSSEVVSVESSSLPSVREPSSFNTETVLKYQLIPPVIVESSSVAFFLPMMSPVFVSISPSNTLNEPFRMLARASLIREMVSLSLRVSESPVISTYPSFIPP